MSVSSDLLLLRSKDRVSGGVSNDFKLNLQENLSGTYEFASFNMFNSLYNVVAGENDKLYVEHSVDGNNTLTLTPGFYTAAELDTELTTQLDSISAVTYTITFDVKTGKYTFTPSSGNFAFKFLTNTADTCRFLIGKNGVDDVLGATQVSDTVANFILHDNIIIKIGQDNNQHLTLPDGTEASLMVPVDIASFGNVINYRRNQSYPQFLTFSSVIASLDIQLLDENGGLLPINGIEWTMSIKKIF